MLSAIQTWEQSVSDPKLKRTKQLLFQCQQRPQLLVVYTTQQLVDYINAHHVPFYVKHQRQTTTDIFFGLVTELYTCNNRVCFKVLYPYDPQHLAIGRLYTQLSAASSAMYADYSLQKTRELCSNKPCVETPNSNGWEHLLAQVPCARSDHDHAPYAYSIHLNHMLPPKMREALRQGTPCEINLAMLPQPVAVPHSLQLDHLIDADDSGLLEELSDTGVVATSETRLKELALATKLALQRMLRQQQFGSEKQSYFFDLLRDCAIADDSDAVVDNNGFRIMVTGNPFTHKRKRQFANNPKVKVEKEKKRKPKNKTQPASA